MSDIRVSAKWAEDVLIENAALKAEVAALTKERDELANSLKAFTELHRSGPRGYTNQNTSASEEPK